jgi:hypothetical protein
MTVPADDTGVRVEVENVATPAEVRAVQATLDEFGIPATAEPTLEPEGRGGPEEIALIVQIAVTSGVVTFLTALISEGAKDVYARLASFMGRLRSRREKSGYQVDINDRRTGLVLSLQDDDPPEAFAALADIDLEALRPGTLYYLRDDGQWHWEPHAPDELP